jgi:hypothetical protein
LLHCMHCHVSPVVAERKHTQQLPSGVGETHLPST